VLSLNWRASRKATLTVIAAISSIKAIVPQNHTMNNVMYTSILCSPIKPVFTHLYSLVINPPLKQIHENISVFKASLFQSQNRRVPIFTSMFVEWMEVLEYPKKYGVELRKFPGSSSAKTPKNWLLAWGEGAYVCVMAGEFWTLLLRTSHERYFSNFSRQQASSFLPATMLKASDLPWGGLVWAIIAHNFASDNVT